MEDKKGKKIVIAIGGNALGNTPTEQLELLKNTAKSIVDLVETGNEVIIVHGNGPQVGMINNSFESSKENINTPEMPFAECGAMSQGYIGYHLQQSIQNELKSRGISKPCATVVTQVVVDKEDPAFDNPTKPIGNFLTKEEAEEKEKETGDKYVEDAGRGYRKVVPSPAPKEIVEAEVVEELSKSAIVVTGGGGGIPVIETDKGYEGIDSVIDKDKTSSRLAIDINADMLLILTAVPQVYLDFGTENQRPLEDVTLEELEEYMKNDEFDEGSMLPKMQALYEYVQKTGGIGTMGLLEDAGKILEGETGTRIIKAREVEKNDRPKRNPDWDMER